METKSKNLIKFLILPLIVIAVLSHFYTTEQNPDRLLHIEFYNIGQGDSFLITTHQGNQVLVDGGPGDLVLQHLSKSLGVFDKTLEMVVLTHPHLDHMEGLIGVLNKYAVKKILLPKVEYESELYGAFSEAVREEGAEVIYAVQGQRIYLDQATVLDILHPLNSDPARPNKSAEINDTSIVGVLSFGKSRILLTGDAGTNIEHQLLKNFNLDSDLLKVGHHGSKHSTSREFLDEVTPEFGVIQLGKNSYGHPALDVLKRLEEARVKVYRTDKTDEVEFVSDGDKIWQLEK